MLQSNIHYMEQRSPEWYQIREGRVTASNVSSILGKITLAKTLDAIENMAIEKAIEQVHGMIEDNYVSFDMQRGIDSEPSAFQLFKDKMELNFLDVEQVGFVTYGENMGCSPDGVVSNGDILEIKCPNAKNFFSLVITDKIEPKHIAQMQMQMLCTGANRCHYFAYLFHRGKEYTYHKIINKDEDFQALLLERVVMVTESKMKFIDKLTSDKQNILITPIEDGVIIEKL